MKRKRPALDVLGSGARFGSFSIPSFDVGRGLGGGSTPGTVVVAAVTGGVGVDLTDAVLHTTGQMTITAGRPTYMYVEGSLSGGGLNDPIITCSNTDTLTKLSPIGAFGSFTNKTWVYGFIPTTGGSTFTFDIGWNGQLATQACWKVVDATGTVTTNIGATYISDSNRFIPTFANANALSMPIQADWHANNVNMLFGLVGAPQANTSAGVGSPTKVGADAQSGAAGACTLGVYALTGGADAIGMSWDGSAVSNHAHVIELVAANTTVPPLAADIIGTPIHITTGTSAQTYASISPAANALLVMCVQHTGNPGALRTITDPIGGTLAATWVEVGTALDFDTIATPVQRMAIYTAQMGASPGSGTVIVSFSAATAGQHVTIVQIPGAAATGQVVQSASASGDAGTAVAASLAAFGHANNGTLFFVGSDPAAAGDVIEGSGFEELDEGSFVTPSSKLNTFWRHSNDTTPTGTLPVTGDWGARALEIKAV